MGTRLGKCEVLFQSLCKEKGKSISAPSGEAANLVLIALEYKFANALFLKIDVLDMWATSASLRSFSSSHFHLEGASCRDIAVHSWILLRSTSGSEYRCRTNSRNTCPPAISSMCAGCPLSAQWATVASASSRDAHALLMLERWTSSKSCPGGVQGEAQTREQQTCLGPGLLARGSSPACIPP